MKPKPRETPLRQRSRSDNLVINVGYRVPSPPRGHIHLVKPKKELATVMKEEHEDMADDLESGHTWSRVDYVAQKMER